HGANACVAQCTDPCVGMLRCVVAVRPVDDGGDSGVERLQRAQVVADVDVLGSVSRAEGADDRAEVLIQRARGHAAPQRGLPQVPVGVDEPGGDDAPGRVDDLGTCGPGAVLQLPIDGHDPAVPTKTSVEGRSPIVSSIDTTNPPLISVRAVIVKAPLLPGSQEGCTITVETVTRVVKQYSKILLTFVRRFGWLW